MTSSMHRYAFSAALATCILASPVGARVARADVDPKPACLAASSEAQELRSNLLYRAARAQLLVCKRPQCPAVVSADCTRWLVELEDRTPTLVIAASDVAGVDTQRVRVRVDGVVVAERTAGTPIPVDPGPHTVSYELDWQEPIAERIVARDGEKNRVLRVSFRTRTVGDAAAVQETPLPVPAPPLEAPPPPPTAPTPILPRVGWTATGLGAVAGGVSIALGLLGTSDVRHLRDSCSPNCDVSSVDSAHGKLVAADVMLGVSAILVASGFAMLIIHYTGGRNTAAQRPSRFTNASTTR